MKPRASEETAKALSDIYDENFAQDCSVSIESTGLNCAALLVSLSCPKSTYMM